MNDKEPLDLFSELMIFGKVTGPYDRGSSLYYTYSITGLERIQFIICNLWLWLSPRRKEQAILALKRFHSFEVKNHPRAIWRNRSNI